MIETKIVAYTNRCNLLYDMGIPFETYWVYDVLYFAFPDDIAVREAMDAFNVNGIG